ncbi:N-acetylmuramoyl-L-alanine amidase [Myceligenerans salitolerans]|uniref:N-acetylmuramoyl-L-alanine amidase n=1 Tax=Myceligenerans salitolerans TaxID=1230528 RepID=A0ABS3I6E5_9MICO|nr:N-acetylmuramoyl-L-alanine amidase [Myceligenerans salitolerans]MBO0607652.1 N-acetylmuramoyl-L-alanine amidase [Myceligenerans salitolerans]
MTSNRRRTLARVGAVLLAAVVGVPAVAAPAAADVDYNPAGWNGKRVYLSQACHDGNDGVPGGSCITNHGCRDYSENSQSFATALHAINGVRDDRLNLLERGYRVRRGTGTLNQNVNSSNNYGADLHIPIHSNARSEKCGDTTGANHGTLMMYVSAAGRECSDSFVRWFGPGSPGTNDVRSYRSNLGELNNTNAVACYLEMEFHTWNKGRNWLLGEQDYSWRIGRSIDEYLGYP